MSVTEQPVAWRWKYDYPAWGWNYVSGPTKPTVPPSPYPTEKRRWKVRFEPLYSEYALDAALLADANEWYSAAQIEAQQ